MLQLLPQFADMALDHVLVDVLVEESVDSVKDLRFADTPAAAAQEKLKDPPLTTRKREGFAVHLGLAPIEVDPQFANRHMTLLAKHTAIDRPHSRQDLAHMHRLSHDVVDAGGEQTESVVERVALVETEHRRVRPLPDHPRQHFTFTTVSDQERLDRMHVRVANLADPFTELCRLDARGRDAFATKTG